MKPNDQLWIILDALVDRWCERRALYELRIILQAYPLSMGLTDEWQNLYQALRFIRSQDSGTLPQEEADKLGEAIIMVGQVLYPEDYH